MIFITKPLVFTILLMGIFGITEVVSTKRGRRIRPSVQAYQNQNLPIQQSPPPVPQNNYYKPSSGYSTTTAQKPVRPAAPRPGIVVFGVGPHSLQIPNQYSNFPAPSYQNGKPISQIPYTSHNTAATKPALKPNPAAKPVAYIEPVKSSNPVQHVQPAKSPQYGNKIPTSNYANQQRPSSPEVPKAPAAVVKVPEKVPVYISPVKSTVYASAYVSDPSNSPASNAYTKKETSDYQTTTPSYTSKSSVSSSYKDTKAYQTTETYSKITTKSEIKENQPSYYSTTSSTVKVSENISKKEKSYAKKEESDAKKEESDAKKEESDAKKEESHKKKEESKVDEKSKTPAEPQSYKKVESLATVSEGKKKEESNTKKEESEVDESKSKTPVYPEPQSYKKVESLATISEGKKKEESNTKKEESDVNVNKSKSPVYSAPQPYKKLESSSVTEEKKKEDSPSYSYSAPQSKPESDTSSKKNSDEVSKVEKSKPKTPIYPIPQSYKKAESQPDNEEKKKLDGPAYVPHSVQENKPVKESYGKNPYQESFVDESEPKGPIYSASLSSNKKVESLPSSEQKKKYDSPSLPYYAPKQKPLSEPSNKKNQNKESDADETKVKTSGYSAPQYYKEVEALPHTADNQKQNVPNYIPTSKPYQQPKSAPVSVSTKASYPAKEEVNSYSPAPISVPTKASYSAKEEVKSYSQSKPTESPVYSTKATKSSEYSTETTTTTQKYKIPSQDRTKSYYGSTSKYQESTTYSTLATSTETQKVYTSSTYEKIPVATTQGYSGYKYPTTTKAYNTKSTSDELVSIETPYVSYSSTASPGVKSNDRVYVVSSQEEQAANLYQKPEPSSNYQSYSNTGRDQSGDDRSSYLVKPVVNEYKSTEKSSKDYTPIDTENKTNYKPRPIASPADYLSTYNSKPSNEKIDSSKIFAAVAENFKTGVHTADGSSENEGDYSAIPGEPGTDYPIFSELPNDQFNCSEQRLPGYYADVSARCQVFHICLGDRQWSFLCPNGTIFSQEHFVCVWWYEFDCSKATSLYDLNEKLFVISSTEQSTEGENEENKQYGESSAISEISKKSDQDYRSSITNKEESIIGAY